jgi:hypothetical protein
VGFGLYAVAGLLAFDPLLGGCAVHVLSRQLDQRLVVFGPQALAAGAPRQAPSNVQADGSMTPLVFVAYPVDDFDTRRAVTDHQYRFYAIPSLVDLVGPSYRVVLISGPSRVVPFARSPIVRRPSLLVKAVNVHVTPMIAANWFLRSHRWARPERNMCYNNDKSRNGRGQVPRTMREERWDVSPSGLSAARGGAGGAVARESAARGERKLRQRRSCRSALGYKSARAALTE